MKYLIKDYEDYAIDDQLIVWSKRIHRSNNPNGELRKLKPIIGGYPYVVLYNAHGHKNKTMHRLVADAFIPNPDNKKEINHLDGDRTNYRIENLERCSRKENAQHAHKTGLMKPVITAAMRLASLKAKSKAVLQFSLDDIFIAEHCSQAEAQRVTKIHQNSISETCRGKRNHAGKFKWRFK